MKNAGRNGTWRNTHPARASLQLYTMWALCILSASVLWCVASEAPVLAAPFATCQHMLCGRALPRRSKRSRDKNGHLVEVVTSPPERPRRTSPYPVLSPLSYSEASRSMSYVYFPHAARSRAALGAAVGAGWARTG